MQAYVQAKRTEMAETRAQIQASIDEKISSLRRASLLRAIFRIVRFGFDVASFAAGAMASGGATVIKTAFDAYYLLKDGLNLYDDLSQQAEARLAGFPNDPEILDARAKLQAAHVDTEPARQLYAFLSSFGDLDSAIAGSLASSQSVARSDVLLPKLHTQAISAAQLSKIGADFMATFRAFNGQSMALGTALQKMADMAHEHVDTVRDWYILALQIQALRTQQVLIQVAAKEIRSQLQRYLAQLPDVDELAKSTEALLHTQDQELWMRTMSGAVQLTKGLSYATLKDHSGLARGLTLKSNLTRLDEFRAQCSASEREYAAEMALFSSGMCWIQYNVTLNQTLSELKTTGTAILDIPLPNVSTSYFNVRMISLTSVQAFLSLEAETAIDIVKIGNSLVYDHDFNLFSVNIPSVPVNFRYRASKQPKTQTDTQVDRDSNTHSPYGLWQITVLNPGVQALQQVDQVTFKFAVVYQQRNETGRTSPLVSIFGVPNGVSCLSAVNPGNGISPGSLGILSPSLTPTNAPGSGTGGPSPSSPSPSSQPAARGQLTSSPASSASQRTNLRLVIIIGGSCGTALFLAAILIAGFIIYKRRKRPSERNFMMGTLLY
jgi:hypothetical protein